MFFRISSILATRSHAGLIFRTVNKTFWKFFGFGVEIALSHRHVEKTLIFSGEKIQQSTASMRTSRLLLNNIQESLHKWCVRPNAGRLSAKSAHHQASIASAPRVVLGYDSLVIFKWIKKRRIISRVSAACRSLFSVSAACRRYW